MWRKIILSTVGVVLCFALGMTQNFVIGAKNSTITTQSLISVFEEELGKDNGKNISEIYLAMKTQYAKTQDRYVRSKLFEIIKRMEETYPELRTQVQAKLGASWKSGDRTFIMEDGSRFSSTKSSIKTKSTNDNIEKTILEKKQTVSNRASSINTTSTNSNTTSNATTVLNKQTKSSNPDRYELQEGRIDIGRVKEAWVGRVNALRAERNLPALVFDERLDKTGAEWAKTIRDKRSADHKRFPNSAYYDYGELVEWFEKRGIVFENVSRATFTENIGWAYFPCDEGDCTDVAIASLKRTYQFFRDEEGQAYDAHRRTMIHPLFRVVGLGISVDEKNNAIYIAIHYGTKVK